jgi:hypothetical protein
MSRHPRRITGKSIADHDLQQLVRDVRKLRGRASLVVQEHGNLNAFAPSPMELETARRIEAVCSAMLSAATAASRAPPGVVAPQCKNGAEAMTRIDTTVFGGLARPRRLDAHLELERATFERDGEVRASEHHERKHDDHTRADQLMEQTR